MGNINCADCGKKIITTGNRQLRCKDCVLLRRRLHQKEHKRELTAKAERHPCTRCGKPIQVVYNYCRPCVAIVNATKYRNETPRQGYISKDGYKYVSLSSDDFFWPMLTNKMYVREHRLIMAKHLGRCLQSWEIIHHRNGDKLDNRIENLQLVMDGQHKQITIMETRIKNLEARVTLLEAENALLRVENKGIINA